MKTVRSIVAALVFLGLLMLALSVLGLWLLRQANLPWFVAAALAQGLAYLLAAWVVLRSPSRPGVLGLVLLMAVLLRLALVFSPPLLSDDIYRYVWDGRVQAAGINPYRFVPADSNLAQLRDAGIYPNINRREYAHTIYPPLAQAIFLGSTRISESVIWMKATMVAFEAVAVWALIRLLVAFGWPAERVLLYAWHPLAIWEVAGSGHLDAVAVMFVVLALWARKRDAAALGGAALACAALIKLFPVVLFPALYRKWDWKMPAAFAATLLAGYAPYISVGAGVLGFLPGHVKEEGLSGGWGIFLLNALRRILDFPELGAGVYLAFSVLVLLGLSLWWMRRAGRDAQGYVAASLGMAVAFTVLLSPHYPWYLLWLVPLLCLHPSVPALYLTTASFVLYEALLHTSGPVLFRLNALLYVPMAVLWVIHLLPGVSAPLARPKPAAIRLEKRSGTPVP